MRAWDVSKGLREHEDMAKDKGHNWGEIFASELSDLYKIASPRGFLDAFKLCTYSFQYGFIRGYKVGKEASKNRAT